MSCLETASRIASTIECMRLDLPMRLLWIATLSLASFATATTPSATQDLVNTVTIGAWGNVPDSSGLGAVTVPFRMGVTEVTNPEWVAMLNAVAAADPNGLFDDGMTDSDRGGILRSGSPGSYTYSLKPDFSDKPVNWISWYDVARFCNWLHNGQPVGAQGSLTTEDGAYDLSLPGAELFRKPGALWFVPTHDEWYKAAYHDPFDPGADAGGTPDYWFYPTMSDALPALALADGGGDVINPGSNVANTDKAADWNGENGNVTTVGGCTSITAWGLFDMGGNMGELTETPAPPIAGDPPLPTRRLRGGDFANTGVLMGSPAGFAGGLNMAAEAANIGARVAAFAPWADLGFALAGIGGEPELSGSGNATAGTLVTLTLSNAQPNVPVTIVIGVGQLNAPLKGGTLVPSVNLLFSGLLADGTGTLVLPAVWPGGIPSGASLYLQAWMPDTGGPQGFAASNGLWVRTP